MANGYLIGESLLSRIRTTVDRVDGMPSRVGEASIPTRLQSTEKVFRICTFTGPWAKNATKTVTFKSQTTAPNTVVATNLFATITTAAGSRNCAIAKEGTAWFLIAAECD